MTECERCGISEEAFEEIGNYNGEKLCQSCEEEAKEEGEIEDGD